jgi:Tol biopolymer transport system component
MKSTEKMNINCKLEKKRGYLGYPFLKCSLVMFLLLTTFTISCSQQNNPLPEIGLFDISNNDSTLLFSFNNGTRSSIYQIDINGNHLKLIMAGTKKINYFNPKYSKDSKKILFLGRRNDKSSNATEIFTANSDGTKMKQVTDAHEIITEAIFSKCEDKIYYCKANEFGHSSPFLADQTHDVDIYSLDLKSKKVERVTNLNAYALFHISEYDCGNILMYMPVPDKESMVMCSKIKPNELKFISPKNTPRPNPSMYYAPVYSKKYNSLAFIATFELMIMDTNDKYARVVVNQNDAGHSQINNLAFFNKEKKLAYTTNLEPKFFIVNFDGTGLKRVKIPIK